MYILVVLLQTLVLPLVSVGVQLAVAGGDPLVAIGVWWAFWGVGTRLTLAGISQLANPARTTRGILGIDNPKAALVVHELGFANLSMGAVALVAAFAPGWGVLGAVPGAVSLGLAGLRHIATRGKGREEVVATWTDLLVFAAVALGLVGMLLR